MVLVHEYPNEGIAFDALLLDKGQAARLFRGRIPAGRPTIRSWFRSARIHLIQVTATDVITAGPSRIRRQAGRRAGPDRAQLWFSVEKEGVYLRPVLRNFAASGNHAYIPIVVKAVSRENTTPNGWPGVERASSRPKVASD